MESTELKHWIAFNRVSGVGRARIALIEGHFGSLERAWQASTAELIEAGLDRRTARTVTKSIATINPDDELARVQAASVRALTWHDEDYPARLKEIYDKPPVLNVRGSLLAEDERAVAVVGTRRPTAYGRQATYQITHDLARSGVTIVSGLARGIDAIAHRAALEAGQRTIAVMGSGLDVIYPREHAALVNQIVENGAVMSEHPLGAKPSAQNFPRRNRIISGLTMGTVVIEAPEGSGALLTSRHALEQDREVFAVPGSIFSPGSKGVNELIRDSGAKLVLDAEDVLAELNLSATTHQLELAAFFPEDEAEAAVLKFVTFDPVHIDDITRNSALAVSTVSSALTMMELKGLVKQVGGMNYMRLRETRGEYQVV
ncbi:MAG: DNA-protecting protein DprA [SAR202 cluster bacterium]|nr:DNA-processing protein DprA [SAR202 cluster bacterium]MQG68000.1 DNA-protecting protein DprA [SAR202 cluster bacterium]